ncbi:TM1812 family CRISPR-associated protein [Caldicellulosiruptor acetigenus]|uniref:TM1812 family CRISPR-associated protein n=1 Tax=Caldicellulosiruptor acetigenus TaxID=301953 RepID=UPI0038BBB979
MLTGKPTNRKEFVINIKKIRETCNVIFFAHCGLEKHFIRVEKNDKGAFVRYIDDLPKLRDIIKEMLLQRIQ